MRDPWVPVDFAAHILGRQKRTIRNWAASGIVRRKTVDGALFVHLSDAARESATRSRRQRGTKAKVIS